MTKVVSEGERNRAVEILRRLPNEKEFAGPEEMLREIRRRALLNMEEEGLLCEFFNGCPPGMLAQKIWGWQDSGEEVNSE